METWEIVLAVPVVAYLWRATFRWALADTARPGKDLDAEGFAIAMLCATVAFWAIGPFVVVRDLFTASTRGVDWPSLARSVGGETRAQRSERRARERERVEEASRRADRELGINQ